LGYGFIRFRSKYIAERWRELLQGTHFPGNSKKKLLALNVTGGIVPDFEGFQMEIRLPMRNRFWFDHETHQDIVLCLNEKRGQTGRH